MKINTPNAVVHMYETRAHFVRLNQGNAAAVARWQNMPDNLLRKFTASWLRFRRQDWPAAYAARGVK